MPFDSPIVWFVRVVAASVAVAIVPGVLAVLAWRPRAAFGLIELVAIGLGVSFGLVELLTVLALTLHWPTGRILILLAGWVAVHAALAIRRPDRAVIRVTASDVVLALVLAVLGIFLYAAGSPFQGNEDPIHVAIVQRLVHLPDPSIGNIYVAPDIVYTYPFPGTHYLLALIARAGDIDALFLYDKMRAFWGIAAAILLYGCARVMFESTRVALVVTFVAIGLAANGTFGVILGMNWGQLVPYSHASDVAMSILLPALLLLAFEHMRSTEVRERRFFLAATLAMAFMLIVVHAREIVQFLVYLTVFAVVRLASRDERFLIGRAARLVGATVGMLVVFTVWHAWAVPTVDTLVTAHRADLRDIWRNSPWTDLFGPPLPLLRNYIPAMESTFYGWNPLVLLASPFVLFPLRRQPLTWLAAAAIVCYVLIVSFPAFGVPYIYLTYFEILYTPIRNVIFFIHLLAGVTLYLIAARLARLGTVTSGVLAIAISVAIAGVFHRLGPLAAEHQGWLVLAVLTGYAVVSWQTWRTRGRAVADEWIERPAGPWVLALACLILPILVMTRFPESSPLNVSWADARWRPDAMMPESRCNDGFCPPPAELIRFARTEVPTDSVFSIDSEERYPSALFMPQRIVAWPRIADSDTFVALFPRYFEHYRRTMDAYQEQPLYNERETREERLSFIRELGVTHVLVNPRLHDVMSAVLARDPDLFKARYDDGRWALYEVIR